MSELLTLLRRTGPAIVVAAVVLGPGSIVTASKVGCEFGYELLWLLPLAIGLMISMTLSAMAIGATQRQTPCQAVAETFGRPFAWIVGVSMAVAVTMFQASNNNALLMAAEGFVGPLGSRVTSPTVSATIRTAVPLLFNAFVMGLLWASRRGLYRGVERAMGWLVAIMVLAFAVNLFFAAPSLSSMFAGLIPSIPSAAPDGRSTGSWMTAGAMMTTTFSVAAAFYQAYQVREKGWTESELRLGFVDTLVGICSLGLITAMILVTAAAALHGQVETESLTDAAAVARALEPTFGSWARYIFALGVLAGAISSFVVNALIGAVVFCDSIGKSSRLSDSPVRYATFAMLGLGWLVSAMGVVTGIPLADFIVLAQALTVFAFPILGATIIWQARRIERGKLPAWVMPLNYVGIFVVVLLSARTLFRILA
ncbi:MAG: divalent metal cation transporter [Planctomycetota bacterium]